MSALLWLSGSLLCGLLCLCGVFLRLTLGELAAAKAELAESERIRGANLALLFAELAEALDDAMRAHTAIEAKLRDEIERQHELRDEAVDLAADPLKREEPWLCRWSDASGEYLTIDGVEWRKA